MVFVITLALAGLTLSAVAIYYSVIGLTAIFSAAFWPIVIMGTALEVSKLVAASWLKANWDRIPKLMKTYMLISVVILMLITSMGIFGFLSKAHSDQTLVSGEVQSKLSIYDEKIKTAKENIESNRRQLKQMDEAVDQIMARSTSEEGATKANNIRKSQQRDRSALAKDIEAQQKLISQLNDEAAPIRAENRKVEAEVGPIKYIATFVYGDNPDANILEKSVTWVIMIIIFVFDPLAVLMLLASQMTYHWKSTDEVESEPEDQEPVDNSKLDDMLAAAAEEERLLEEANTKLSEIEAEEPTLESVGIIPEPEVTTVVEEQVDEEQVDEELDEVVQHEHSDSMKEAMAAWKKENPDDSLKRQKHLLEIGVIDALPWEEYLKPEADFVSDNEAAAEAAKWAAEQLERPGDYLTPADDESKKKDSILDGKSREEASNQDGGEVGYQQNAEQTKSTLWSRIHKE